MDKQLPRRGLDSALPSCYERPLDVPEGLTTLRVKEHRRRNCEVRAASTGLLRLRHFWMSFTSVCVPCFVTLLVLTQTPFTIESFFLDNGKSDYHDLANALRTLHFQLRTLMCTSRVNLSTSHVRF